MDQGAVTVEILFIRTDPVQEIAAEPGTLDYLADVLRPKAVEPRATPELLAVARLTGWPLVYDDTIRPGYVHCRPSRPDAAEGPSVEELLAYFQRLMPATEEETGA